MSTHLHTAVRVIYRRDPSGGWTYTVLAAQGPLRVLGEGWSAGKKRDAEDAYRMAAASNGWIDQDSRQWRQRGAA